MAQESIAPLGERYFQTRERLKNVIEALGSLGAETGLAEDRLGGLTSKAADLENPFLLVVVGDADPGKSTLLDALFGGEFLKAGFAPASGRIALLQYGTEARESDFSEDIVEVFRPINTLKDFTFLNLPSARAIGSAYDDVAERFLPEADLVLFVFSVKNPWSEATWELLGRIHRQWGRKIVIVLQQSDLRTGEEVLAIREHTRKTALLRFRRNFPVFSVSARTALLARTPGHDTAALHQHSGIESLQLHLSGMVESSVPRLVALTHACRAAREVMEEIKERHGEVSEIIRADDEILSTLEASAATQMELTRKNQEALLDGFDQSFVSAGLQAEPLLDEVFRFASILRPRQHRIGLIDDRISALTLEAVRGGIGSGASAVTEDVDKLWDSVAHELKERFDLELSTSGSGRPNWEEPRRRLSESVEQATSLALSEMKLVDELRALFRQRTRLIWGCVVTAILLGLAGITLTVMHRGLPGNAVDLLVELAAGVVFTMLEQGPWNALALASALVFLIVAAAVGIPLAKQAREVYQSILNRHRKQIARAQRDAVGEQTAAFYRDFVAFFDPLRKVCREHRGSYESGMREIERTESSLAEVERVLHPVITELISHGYAPRELHRDDLVLREV